MSKINQRRLEEDSKADQDIGPGSSDDVQSSDDDEFDFINQHLANKFKVPEQSDVARQESLVIQEEETLEVEQYELHEEVNE